VTSRDMVNTARAGSVQSRSDRESADFEVSARLAR
jgi:hypothetical protein